jgi:hypothetical protein
LKQHLRFEVCCYYLRCCYQRHQPHLCLRLHRLLVAAWTYQHDPSKQKRQAEKVSLPALSVGKAFREYQNLLLVQAAALHCLFLEGSTSSAVSLV